MKAPSTVLRFEEAVLWFRQRLPSLSDAEFERLVARVGREARRFSGKAQLDLTAEVWRGIDDAVANGTTLADFKARIDERIKKLFGSNARADASRLDTIFRTNVQSAYGGGRVAQLKAPETLAVRTYWRFSAILDSRTSAVCEECGGVVLPAGHPWWDSHQPPLHHGCRSTIISMRESAAKRRGITSDPPRVEASEGFGNVESEREFRPKSPEYPAELVSKWKQP